MRLTKAMIPMSRTGHSKPLEYAGRIAKMRPASIPAKIASRVTSSDVAVQVRHLLSHH
jgi:hypothetical protein